MDQGISLNRSSLPERRGQVQPGPAVSAIVDALGAQVDMVGKDLDTDGGVVPTWKAHAFTYDGSGNLQTDTVTDGTSTWVRSYDYPNGTLGSDSGWVKQ